jgi:capsular exopolysaccharide synthesis family protein
VERDVREYARVIWRRRWYGLLGFVLCVALALAYTATRTPRYQATATLFVGDRQLNLQDINRGIAVTNLSERLLKSYAEIVTSRTIAERAVVDNALPLSAQSVQRELTVQPLVDTQILKVTFLSKDPALAERVANAVASAFVAEIQDIAVPPTVTPPVGATPLPTPATQAPPPAAVTVSIIDPAVRPKDPVSPNHQRDLALGILLGMMVGIAMEFTVDYLDVSIKTREDTERLGLPVVGLIPKLDTGGADVYVERDPRDIGRESFRKLRTSIGFLSVEKPLRTILVTSPIAGEGKTTVAVNLAVAYAQAGSKTVIVEADLRRPSLHRLFGTSGTDGLTTAIIGEAQLARSVRAADIPNLHCLVAGAIPPNPVELLQSEHMDNVLEMLRHQFEVIVVDAPPILPVADSLALAPKCDGVLVVARSGSTPRERLTEAVNQIEKSGARFLGVAVNCVRRTDSPYEYEYYYNYRAGSAATETAGQAAEKPTNA